MKSVKKLFLVGIGALTLWSCNNATTSSDTQKDELSLHPLTNDPQAEKQYLFLRLAESQETDSSMVYLAKSVYESDTIALQIEVLKGIKPGVSDDNKPLEAGFSEGSIRFLSVGDESDKFVAALGSIFGLDASGKMTAVVSPTVFSSNKNEIDFSQNGTYSFKLFFENEVGEPAEVFTVLDTYRRSFEIEEKDSAQRQQLLSAFEAK